ncbi:MAG: glycosyltransferase [Firmicutes bacterium]|nr:glycosyltransferase [Bacillota bacterium]
MFENTLYVIGLILVTLYLTMGFDDFLWDIYSLTKRAQFKNKRLDFKVIRKTPEKLLAVTIGAWNESQVIGAVIENLISSIQYPKSMYHLFVGVYPNDQETIDVVKEMEKRFSNVHMVINVLPGPTTKAQNINYVISQVKQYEKQFGWRFASITVHDAEDVIHPYEFMVTNYMIDKYDGLQFPVFPLMQMPKFSNFFKTMTVSTYADEFAENHFNVMVGRYSTGAFVPSAGTGFALSRKTIDTFETDEILPNDSITEDYRLSLTLFEKGLRIRYVLDLIPRVSRDDKIIFDYIATRSMFPTTFKAAVKQKTRWILGITMQSVAFKDIFAKNGLSFMGRYSLYRDLKAKIGNLLVFVGYPVLVYFFVSLFMPLTPIYPFFSLSWYLSLIVTIMMIERQISRSIAVYNVYGFKSMFFACLLPPILPLRIIWGNVINLSATIKAYIQSLSGNKEKKKVDKKQQSFAWSKTDHTFLPKEVLNRYHRTFGDVLIEKGLITPEALKETLNKKPAKIHIGEYLLQEGLINEHQLLEVLAHIKGIEFVDMGDFSTYDLPSFTSKFDKDLLEELMVLPIVSAGNSFVIAYCESSPDDAQTILREKLGIKILSAFTTTEMVREGLEIMFGLKKSKFKNTIAFNLLNTNKINTEQYIIACNHAIGTGKSSDEILQSMGLLVVENEANI